MLKEIGASVLKDFIGLMKEKKDFFSLSETQRKELMTEHYGSAYPLVFQDYLSRLKPEIFMAEVKELLTAFEAGMRLDPKNNLLNAIADYISETFATSFDQLDTAFFFSLWEDRQQKLQMLFPGNSALNQAIRDFVQESTSQEVALAAAEVLAYIKKTPIIVIQSPVELDSALRSTVRSNLIKKYPNSFPQFQVNPQIIGGMRVFVGGKIVDESWLTKIQGILTLSAN